MASSMRCSNVLIWLSRNALRLLSISFIRNHITVDETGFVDGHCSDNSLNLSGETARLDTNQTILPCNVSV